MLRKLGAYAPSLVVLFTVALVLVVGPFAIRKLTFAQTQVAIKQASDRLNSGSNILEEINQVHRDIATKVEPSVVYIATMRGSLGRENRPMPLSSGSGWVYDSVGHIVTNEHVVRGAERIQVQLSSGELRDATMVGSDPNTDVAVLKIPAGELHPAERAADVDNVQQGDRVFAFGSPFDFRFSMSQGIVSGLKRDAQLADVRYQNFIQVDAAINPGNSGGPLTDIYGQVIGMNTAIATSRQGSQNEGVFAGIGLAIPIEMIEHVVGQLIDNGEVSRGFIGVTLIDEAREPSIAKTNGFRGEGAEISRVNPGGPAERAGLRAGDVILSVDGNRIAAIRQIQSIISSHLPGETLRLEIWRFNELTAEGETRSVEVTLDELNPELMLSGGMQRYLQAFGLLNNLSTSTEERAARMNVPYRRGVLVERVPAGAPIEGVIRPGTTIVSVMNAPVSNVDEFYANLARAVTNSPREVALGIFTPDGRPDSVYLRP